MSKGKGECGTNNQSDQQYEQIRYNYLCGIVEMKVDYKVRDQVFKSS